MKSRTLFSFPDDPDGPTSDTSSSCGYQNALLSWLTGGFSRSAKHQQSVAPWVDTPHTDSDNSDTEVDGRLSDDEVHGESGDRMTDTEPLPAEQNETWLTMSELITESQSGIIQTKLNVTYTATAEVISVKMQ